MSLQQETFNVLFARAEGNPQLCSDLATASSMPLYRVPTPATLPEAWPIRLRPRELGYGIVLRSSVGGLSLSLPNDYSPFQVDMNPYNQNNVEYPPGMTICHFAGDVYPLVWELDKYERAIQLPAPTGRNPRASLSLFAVFQLAYFVGNCCLHWMHPLQQQDLLQLVEQYYLADENLGVEYLDGIEYPFSRKPIDILKHHARKAHPQVRPELSALINWIVSEPGN